MILKFPLLYSTWKFFLLHRSGRNREGEEVNEGLTERIFFGVKYSYPEPV